MILQLIVGNLTEMKNLKYIIIGAVAGGASTAARLRRLDEQAEIVIFEKGQYISYANCGLPYYIGDIIKDRNKLFVQTASSFALRFNADVRVSTEVTAINPTAKTVTATNLLTGEEYTESYDKLVLSPGASPVRPPLTGIQHEGIFTLRNVADTDFIKAYVAESNARKAVVIGAGFIGLEMAENFHELGLDVSVVEMSNQILAPVDQPIAALAQKHLREKGIQLYLNTAVTGFEKNDGQLKVQLKDRAALDADVVILSIGVKPDTRLAEDAGLQIGQAKGIWVNEYLQTSDPDIYAVGDAIEFPNPISNRPTITFLAGPANKQGRICANNLALGNRQEYKGSINTAIVKLFDLTVGTAGMPVKQLQRENIPYLTATIHGNSHAGYYPGAQLMSIQIAFSPDTGRLLSAQVIGAKGVDKRLDLLSSVIKNNGTIYELTELEHAYAPPFSSAKDPVNMAGFVAENILLERLKVVDYSQLSSMEDDTLLIDVRNPGEVAAGTIEGAVNIPLDEIRSRLQEIPRDKPLLIFCQQGMRGYLAQRILVQNGFSNVSNLSGGYLLWKACQDEEALLASYS
ncbi:NADPH-dependent 2,4-dienoyl-CoA reductase/sulfur reductase-like enzyme [Arcticibacter pallidicorallinus]|uniref:NADPH-dependent 2,4-dienoyl-CoA reductase/sulfur reductase-like enzyme n=2 Tax=Arcticibacter pallidicorallinus TaxID=1259464 RepID=A0A2T0U434_9SPHI|nr:NADPH-dependent 2,4-dienoyl-CoA reductase/sulfur reductase-like enzyme [Arcticibacter pallidicorallinus]